jgi:hypothetical protein
MEIREGDDPVRVFSTLSRLRVSRFHFLIVVLAFLVFSGCAAPSEPTTRHAPTPTAINDLAAVQQGDAIILFFNLPTKTNDGKSLPGKPSIEIYRRYTTVNAPAPTTKAATPGATPAAALSFSPQDLAVRIPSAMVDQYLRNGRMRFPLAMRPEELEKHGGELVQFAIRTRVSEKKASETSNVATVLLFYPTMLPIADLSALVAQDAVELTWSPATLKMPGDRLGEVKYIVTYRVYRAEIHSDAAQAAKGIAAPAELPPDAEQVGVTVDEHLRDTKFEFGRNYVYSVRSVSAYGAGPGQSTESADSNLVAITPKDIFPPAAPQEVVAVAVAATVDTPAHIELSWAISPETDLAGYNVYRTEQEGVAGLKLNLRTLPTPSYRDITVVRGRMYSYTVTAVDRAGNESPASVPVTAGLSATEQNESSKP